MLPGDVNCTNHGQIGDKEQVPDRRLLLAIVLVALAFRLSIVAFTFHQQLDPRRDHWAFGWETGRVARSIALGEGFANPLFEKTGPTAWTTPVFPYFVAGVFETFGVYTPASAIILLSFNSLFSALTCVPVFLIARDTFGRKAAMWAAWGWAVFPPSFYFASSFIWETCLTTLLLTWLFYLTLRMEKCAALAAWAGYGLLWGLTALTTPTAIVLLPFLLGWVCLRVRRRGGRWAADATIAVLATLVTVAPWFIRNLRTFQQFIPLRDSFWLVAHVGNNGDTRHWDPPEAHPTTSAREEEQFNRLGELEYMAAKKREVIQFVTAHPGDFVWVSLRRFLFVWTGFWSASKDYLEEEPVDPWNILMSTILLVFMLSGIRRALRENNPMLAPFLLTLAIYPAVYYLTIYQPLYRHPIDPEIVILATYGAMALASHYIKFPSEMSDTKLSFEESRFGS
jgi:4-amino-4-deoxy-L-arabinose transferase-like glycosyltransferase